VTKALASGPKEDVFAIRPWGGTCPCIHPISGLYIQRSCTNVFRERTLDRTRAVCAGLDLKVTREHLDCANRNPDSIPPDWNWLNDEVANALLELLQQRELDDSPSQPRVHYCSTFFYATLCKQGHYDFSRVQRWNKDLTYDILKCKKIVVPIHQGLHWVLAVIHVTDRRLEFLDSMSGSEGKTLVRTHASVRTVIDTHGRFREGASMQPWL
jgi:hypothetical protein